MINIIELVKKLIGRIDPVADTSIDSHRMDNLIAWEDVTRTMLDELIEIGNGDSRYASAQEIHAKAREFALKIAVHTLDELDCTSYGATETFKRAMELRKILTSDIQNSEEALVTQAMGNLKAYEALKGTDKFSTKAELLKEIAALFALASEA